jgi:hypothetical protein
MKLLRNGDNGDACLFFWQDSWLFFRTGSAGFCHREDESSTDSGNLLLGQLGGACCLEQHSQQSANFPTTEALQQIFQVGKGQSAARPR